MSHGPRLRGAALAHCGSAVKVGLNPPLGQFMRRGPRGPPQLAPGAMRVDDRRIDFRVAPAASVDVDDYIADFTATVERRDARIPAQRPSPSAAVRIS